MDHLPPARPWPLIMRQASELKALKTSALSNARHILLLLWTAATGVYLVAVAQKVLQGGSLSLAAVAGLSAMTGAWIYVLDRDRSFEPAATPTTRRIAAFALIATSVLTNSVLIVRAFVNREPLPLIRLLSTGLLLYGLSMFGLRTRRSAAHGPGRWPHSTGPRRL
jgi:hypothetical protein